jgi:broad specificity phosphatase PhoE
MTLRLTLVAHAPTEATRRHRFPLDEPADRPPALTIDARAGALTSSALRCRQTAEATGLAPSVDHRLDDWDLGDWAGRALSDLAPEAVRFWLADARTAGSPWPRC